MRSHLNVASGVLTFLLLAAPATWADSLKVVAGNDSVWHVWQTPSTAQVRNMGWGPSKTIVPGTAFWNNWSIDGTPNHQCNIGFWLSGTGGCTATNTTSPYNAFLLDSPSTTANYLGNGTTGFVFDRSGGIHLVVVTMRVQVSMPNYWDYLLGNVPVEFGWFDASAPSELHPLFPGSPSGTPRGSVAKFFPPSSYGFYLKSQTGTYLSSGAGDTWNHFALFQLQGTDHYIFGLEDWDDAHLSDWDFNDMVIEMQVSPPFSLYLPVLRK